MSREIHAALAAPFTPEQVRERVGAGGMRLRWVPARAVAERLNAVLGVTGWDFYVTAVTATDSVVLGTLTIRLPDGTTSTRTDYGYQTGGSGESLKESSSDALRRCASLVGVATYLWGAEGSSAAPGAAKVAMRAPQAAPAAEHVPTGAMTEQQQVALAAAMMFGGSECPTHHKAWVFREGVAKASGKPYAFWACPSGKDQATGKFCEAKPSREWVAAQGAAKPKPAEDDLSSLPF